MRLSLAKALAGCLATIGLTVKGSELYRSSHMPEMVPVMIAPFGYDGLNGPLNWYGLNKSGNAACDMGKVQSPIDILPATMISTLEGSTVNMKVPSVSQAIFENIGSTVEVVTNGTLMDGSKEYKLVQFHWHTPSEHRLNGMFYEMEEHFLFEAKDASLAVVTFFVELDESGFSGPHTKAVLSEIDKVASPGDSSMTGPLNFEYAMRHLHNNQIYRYTGSITSPPCSEGVNWIISTKPIRIDAATYKRAKHVLKFNSRYIQNEHGKTNLLENAARELSGSGEDKTNAGSSGALDAHIWWQVAMFASALQVLFAF